MNPRTLDSLATPTVSSNTAPNAYQQFNTNLLGLLKRQQQLGTAPFVRQGLDAQQLQANRIAATPNDLIGANPALQGNVRSAAAQAIQPTVQGAGQSAQTFSEQLSGFGNIVNFARQIGAEYQATQERAQDRAFTQIMNAINQYGGGAFQGLDEKELSTMEKTAGLPSGFLGRISKLQTTQEKQFAEGQKITPYQQANLEEERRQFDVQHPTQSRILVQGMEGSDVDALQKFLISQGLITYAEYQTGPGTYGPKTNRAVQEFQRKNGITGEVGFGPKTQAAAKQQGFSLPPNTAPSGGPVPGGGLVVDANGDEWEVITTK